MMDLSTSPIVPIVETRIAPDFATPGQQVRVQVTVTQRTGEPWHIAIAHAKVDPPNTQIYFEPKSAQVQSHESFTFESSFTMPSRNTTLRFNVLIWKSGMPAWERDQEVFHDIRIDTAMRTEIVEISSLRAAHYGQTVPVHVKIRNNHTSALTVGVEGTVHYGPTPLNVIFPTSQVSVPAGGMHTFSGYFSMQQLGLTVSVRSKHFRDGQWHIDDETRWDVAISEEPAPSYWLTIAQGATANELKANAEGKYVHGNSRLVITFSPWVPTWVLASGAWLYDRVASTLAKAGIETREVKVVGRDVRLYTYSNPHPAVIIVLVAIGALTALGITRFVTQLKIQQEITKQLAIKLEIVKEKKEAQDALLEHNEWLVEQGYPPYPPELMETILVALWESGFNPEIDIDDGIWWEKYIKWGLVIAAVALIAPPLIREIRRGK